MIVVKLGVMMVMMAMWPLQLLAVRPVNSLQDSRKVFVES